MRVILYMAITANGMIATEKDEVPHVSKTEWKHFVRMMDKTKNIVIGRKTFELMLAAKEPLKGKVCVVTKNKTKFNALQLPKRIFFAKNPKLALRRMKMKGFDSVLLGGGSKLNASFLNEGLVDEIYLDVEPHLIGKGIPLFFPRQVQQEMELLGTKMLSKNEIQLHYRVKKPGQN